MEKSESIIELAKALNAFQGKLRAVKKDGVNPFFKMHYATLDAIWEAIREPLSASGLAVAQTLSHNDGKALLDTTLLHTSGEWLSGSMLLNPVRDDPQGLGSAISYARRYSLCAMLGVVADEDDDANTATKPKSKPQDKPQIKVADTTTEAEIPADEVPTEDAVDPAWLTETLKIIHWGESTALSWIKSQLKVIPAGKLIEVLNRLDKDKLKTFVAHITTMREASGQ